MKVAARLRGISASPTMEVMQEAQRLKKEGIDVVDLGPGEPDFPTPDHIKQAGMDAIQGDFTKYTPSAGIPELRQAVADHYNSRWGTDFSVRNVVISCGAKHSIYNVCMALFEEGDEVLLPVPYWVTFPEVIKVTGASPVEVITPEENGFILRALDLQPHLTQRTRGLIVNTPSNPTGAVIPGKRSGDWWSGHAARESLPSLMSATTTSPTGKRLMCRPPRSFVLKRTVSPLLAPPPRPSP